MELEQYYNHLKNDYLGHDNAYKFVIDNLSNSIPFAFARFNDGEMMGIEKIGTIAARGDQYVDETLHNALIEAIKYKNKNYYVGIPCPICFPQYYSIANLLVGDYKHKVNAMALQNRNWARFLTELPNVIKHKKVIYISGDDQNIDFLKQSFNLNIIEHLKFPRINTWRVYDDIYPYIENIKNGDLVLLSLGPTARVLTRKWFEQKPLTTFLDIGSIFDPFTRNVSHNYHKGWKNGFNIGKNCIFCN